MRVDVLGVGFDNVTMDQAVQKAVFLLNQDETSYCVTPNAEIVYDSMDDKKLAQILNGADLVLPDGIGIIYGSRILKRPLCQRVAGIDFAAGLIRELAKMEKRLFLLGGKLGIAEIAAQNLCAAYPGLVICGTSDGYFQDDGPVIQAINGSRADVLFVCLGSPKQEYWMDSHKNEVCARFMIGLGGSLDGFAGEVKRAPPWMIKLGLEWLYRLICQPRRIKRMLKLPKFLLAVFRFRLKGG